MEPHLHISSVLHYLDANTPVYYEKGALVVDDATGKILACGEETDMFKRFAGAKHTIHKDKLITPGFIDTHVHYPQMDVMASYGKQLLDWLNLYTFPIESRFSDPKICEQVSEFFLKQCFKHGTTTAMVFATSHRTSVDAFFKASEKYNTRMICGKVLMDCNAPQALLDSVTSSYDESKALIERWHNKGRQHYAVTPRFAITSTQQQLSVVGHLLKEYPSVYLQTHLAENLNEIELVKKEHPGHKCYLDVYEQFDLLGPRSVFAHGVHLSEDELSRLSGTQSKLAFCPSSNLFLGSGLLDIKKVKQQKVDLAIATDVGAGNNLSMLQTLADGYKIAQLTGYSLSAHEGFYQITLGNAKALSLDHVIGNFETGKEADFVVLDLFSTEILTQKMKVSDSLEERLFSLMMLGDDRSIDKTYICGKTSYSK